MADYADTWFWQLFHHSADSLLLLGRAGFVDCNAAALQLLGYVDKSTLLGRQPQDFSPTYQPDGSRSATQAQYWLDQAWTTGNARFEWTHCRNDGSLFHVEVLLTQLPAAELLLVNWRDISERMQARQNLQQRLAFEQLLFKIAVGFINLEVHTLDAAIVRALQDIGEFVAADRSNIFLYRDGGRRLDHRYEWCRTGVESLFERLQDIDVQSDVWRWADTRVKRGEIIAVADTNASGVLNAATMGFVRQNNTRSFILLPMRSQGTTIGLIGFNAREPRATWTNESIQLLRIVGEIFVNALQRRQADDELRQRNQELAALSSRVVTLQESERQAVARELHDDTGQILTALALQLGDLSRRAGGMPEFLTHISELQSMVDTIATRIHRLASDLRPISLDRQSLVVALDDLLATFQRRSRIPVAFDGGDTVDQLLPAVVKTAIYRITQEALTNVARHAHASQVAVLLAQRHGRIQVIIEDNGVGFDTTAAQMRRRLGLLGMRERAEMLGGTLEIESRPGAGTTVFAEVPYVCENLDR